MTQREIKGPNGERAILKQHGRHLWSLTADYCKAYRNRWGNATEINQDVAHFQSTGYLPQPSGQRW